MTPTEFITLRKAKRMTQAEIAALLGKSRKTVVNWENGVFALPIDIVEQLAVHNIVGAVSKSATKAELEQAAHDKKVASVQAHIYRSARAFPHHNNHAKAMATFNSQGVVFTPLAQQMILAEFPDILTDPNGDYTMTKEQSHATLGVFNPSNGE